MIIDTAFDFTSDCPGFWDGYWSRNNGMGGGSCDPDSVSRTLKGYHQFLWSKELPCGEKMCLQEERGYGYLSWKNYRFGSDSITASFRYKSYQTMIEKVRCAMPDYEAYMEHYVRTCYTIGGMMLLPKRQGGINQSRGCNRFIRDRWDLTMDCIRKYYQNERSPLFDILVADDSFWALFKTFKGFVDFFYLQDMVSADYSQILFWEGNGELQENPFPETVEAYLTWIENEKTFVRQRNNRIEKALAEDYAGLLTTG